MEKYMIKGSYVLGCISLGMALLTRAIDVVNPRFSVIPTTTDGIGYRAFMNGALLFFITTVASSCYAWFNSKKSEDLAGKEEWNRADGNPVEIARSLVSGNGGH
ncbi:MAG TPA: hypothetical protein VGI34_01490 [Candidatus Acidoferrales bacterium]|jgi:hypothetical protein